MKYREGDMMGWNFGKLGVFNQVMAQSEDISGDGTSFAALLYVGIGALLIYLLSFAPVAGIASRNRAPSMGTPRWIELTYGPAMAIWNWMPEPLSQAYGEYLTWGLRTFSQTRPTNTRGVTPR
jgi:hypothetical protein